VASHDGNARLTCNIRPSANDLLHDALSQEIPGKREEIQREEGSRAHGVDVRQGVRGGDPPEVVRVVDQGREEVERNHEGTTVAERIHGGVVAGRGVHQRFSTLDGDQVTQDLRQLGHAELTGSAGSVSKLGQPDPGPFVPGFVRHLRRGLLKEFSGIRRGGSYVSQRDPWIDDAANVDGGA